MTENSIPVHWKNKAMQAGIAIVILLVVILLAGGGYFFYQYLQLKRQFGTQLVAQEEARRLVSEVGKIMLLPSNESPTVATVTDISKLKGQPFFQNAKNGDELLIYTNAKEAILYNPQKHLIINVGPVTIGGQQASQATQAKIGLRNGTPIPAITYKVEGAIQKAFPGATIVLKEQDAKTDYPTTTVVILNTLAKSAGADLAKTLNATVGNLPAGETKPSGIDILIIVGKDQA